MRMEITADIDWQFEEGDADHEFCKKNASFTHVEACEFVLHIGQDTHEEDSHFNVMLRKMKEEKCSEDFIEQYRQAGELGAIRAIFYC